MKMRVLGLMAFVLLSISILSIGTSDLVFADDHNIPPISALQNFQHIVMVIE